MTSDLHLPPPRSPISKKSARAAGFNIPPPPKWAPASSGQHGTHRGAGGRARGGGANGQNGRAPLSIPIPGQRVAVAAAVTGAGDAVRAGAVAGAGEGGGGAAAGGTGRAVVARRAGATVWPAEETQLGVRPARALAGDGAQSGMKGCVEYLSMNASV